MTTTLVNVGGLALFIALLIPVVMLMNRVVERAPFGALLLVLAGVAFDIAAILAYKQAVS